MVNNLGEVLLYTFATPNCNDLGEHIGAILTIVGILFGLFVGFINGGL